VAAQQPFADVADVVLDLALGLRAVGWQSRIEKP
jgi:hypothetical protein